MPLTSLVGLPGSGKSTVGRRLARALDRRFVDSDAEIERRIGGSIRDFFASEGEERFRDIEESVIAELAADPDCVLATGGGSVLRARNREVLRGRSTVVYLCAAPEALFQRLRHDRRRPLLQVADPLHKLRTLYMERDPLYREAAHVVVDTGLPSMRELVQMVLVKLAAMAGPHSADGPLPVAVGTTATSSPP